MRVGGATPVQNTDNTGNDSFVYPDRFWERKEDKERLIPELFPFHGDWSQYEDELYHIYKDTIVEAGIIFQGLPVRTQYRPPTKDRGFGFWHMISEGSEEEERTPDIFRCERIRWVAWLIKNAEKINKLS